MCGVIGGVDKKAFIEKDCNSALHKLWHRGPDYHAIDYYNKNRLFLGHARLKIIDLDDRSNQPFLSKCKNYSIIFNGEIFNFKELAQKYFDDDFLHTGSDTEVLLELYIKFGESILNYLNGMFAFAIYNIAKNQLFIAKDRVGIKQLYYYHHQEKFVFCSEIRPILNFVKQVEADERMIKTYLQTGMYDFGEHTFFAGINALQSGHVLNFDINQNKLGIHRWYFLEKNIKPIKASQAEVEEMVDVAMDNAIKSHLVADVDVGVNLSGGLDSSTLLYYASKYKQDIHTFTHEYGGIYSERKWIDELLVNFNVTSHFIDLDALKILSKLEQVALHQGEPFGGIFPIGHNFLYTEVDKNNITVILDGTGVDEIFLGYRKYHLQYLLMHKESKNYQQYLHDFAGFWQENRYTVEKEVNDMDKAIFINSLIDGSKGCNSGIMGERLIKLETYPIDEPKIFDDDVKNMAYRDTFFTKVPRGLRFDDRSSMMLSKEQRVPFFDYRLIELAFSIPTDYLINKNGAKAIVRNVMKNKISATVATAPKRNIQTPQNDWLGREFKQMILSIINSVSFAQRGWFNVTEVKKVYNEYLHGNQKSSFYLWQWINLEVWARQYLD